jgi:hypothetical protein
MRDLRLSRDGKFMSQTSVHDLLRMRFPKRRIPAEVEGLRGSYQQRGILSLLSHQIHELMATFPAGQALFQGFRATWGILPVPGTLRPVRLINGGKRYLGKAGTPAGLAAVPQGRA